MSILIRTATHSDAEALVHIYNQYLGKATQDTIVRKPNFFVQMMDKLEDREILLVVEKEGRIVGYGILKKYSWKEGYRYAGEISLFFDSKHTGGGMGKQLMQRLIDQAKNWEYKHLVSRIMAINVTSIEFHKKLGYEMVGFQSKIGFVDGVWHDVAILQLSLHT